MAGLIFDESTMLEGNIFKFEQRLQSHMNKYVENGALLTEYFSQDENSSTVDRGSGDIDELFGKRSPLRYNVIDDFPVYGFGQANPDNTDEMNVEDINVDGEVTIIPSTIVPKPLDFFIIKHLKMVALFEVTNVSYDSMKQNGFYKIRYHLHSTSHETVQKLRAQVINQYHTDLNAVGSNVNPIIKEDDFILRGKIKQMINKMISSYRALFYNERHNCFLFHHPEMGLDWFDMCGNEFMAKYSIMNYENASKVIVLHQKLHDNQLPLRYHNSIYSWLEMGAEVRHLQKFYFLLDYAETYPDSSFSRWGDGDVQIMQPLSIQEAGINVQECSIFDDTQLNAFMNPELEPVNEYEKLIWKFIHKTDLTINDISLYTADALISSVKQLDTFLYTPIVIYIMRKILGMN